MDSEVWNSKMVTLATLINYPFLGLLVRITLPDNTNTFSIRQSLCIERGETFDQIAKWLNKKGYLSVRRKKFKDTHIYSILKKKRLKDEKLEKQYPEVRYDFYLDIFDKTLVKID